MRSEWDTKVCLDGWSGSMFEMVVLFVALFSEADTNFRNTMT